MGIWALTTGGSVKVSGQKSHKYEVALVELFWTSAIPPMHTLYGLSGKLNCADGYWASTIPVTCNSRHRQTTFIFETKNRHRLP